MDTLYVWTLKKKCSNWTFPCTFFEQQFRQQIWCLLSTFCFKSQSAWYLSAMFSRVLVIADIISLSRLCGLNGHGSMKILTIEAKLFTEIFYEKRYESYRLKMFNVKWVNVVYLSPTFLVGKSNNPHHYKAWKILIIVLIPILYVVSYITHLRLEYCGLASSFIDF